MKFRKVNKNQIAILNGWVNYSKFNFKILNKIPLNDKEIIHGFINSPQDFKVAKKYINGLEGSHRDEMGITRDFRLDIFGLYERHLLTFSDYHQIDFMSLHEKIFNLLSEDEISIEYLSEVKTQKENIKKQLNQLNNENITHYLLEADEEKVNELNPFHKGCFLCAFSLNKVTQNLTIIQIDDD